MKLLTWNVSLTPWNFSRKKFRSLIASSLIQKNADIILLQEVFFTDDFEYLKKTLSKQGFTEFLHNKNLLTISKVPFISDNYRNFTAQGLFFSWAMLDRLYKKGWQVVQIKIKDELIYIINTHTLSAYGHDEGDYTETRKKQIIEIIDFLDKQRAEKFILAGDFNFDKDSETYDFLKQTYDLDDPLASLPDKTITSENLRRRRFNIKKMEQRVDHFFVKGLESNKMEGKIVFNKPWKINGVTTHPSDHYGLGLQIDLK
ncbi:MAG: hypothetical protein A2826_00385 [Candidatus Doudnabacteria bacterium RIFCSPHIGHO2_01_FULL_43_23]|uniref:Endonuclease/exonuclease/phosphatase domain-containing protein n=1 Tax=Candidatus Doudnabacteria bacterium RIFCSPHIGHO2_01_FULL_43_23 TaxID=1817822 RepID=A0A1F5NSN7_9BACT|nr:MAG: hypothetical protein A2826_00385 [Candidatus Doudnabacteria bacterium RIFCSPHIGHO2_01_FULL_43_23]